MKTALEELIKDLKDKAAFDWVVELSEEYLEKEKQQIIEGYKVGLQQGTNFGA